MSEKQLLCLATFNPCGTDTWAAGYACPCNHCQAYLRGKPRVNDFITVDTASVNPADFKDQNISWYTTQVLAVDGNRYKVAYNDDWYTFTQFGEPWPAVGSESPRGSIVWPALPTVN